MTPINAIQAMQSFVDLPIIEHGQNRNPWIDARNEWVGAPLGSPWCAVFDCYGFFVAAESQGKTSDYPKTAGSQDLKAKLIAHGCAHTKDPEVAKTYKAIVIIRTDPGGAHGHVVAVKERLTDGDGRLGAVLTCEGNSNNNGSADGDRAVNHKRFIPLQGDWTWFDVSCFCGGDGWYGAPGAA